MEVARDYDRLRECALAQMEYAARARAAGRRANEVPEPDIPPEYESWLAFLARTERRRTVGAWRAMPLHADVARGLEILEEARAEFRRTHRECSNCGNWMPAYAKRCVCGNDL